MPFVHTPSHPSQKRWTPFILLMPNFVLLNEVSSPARLKEQETINLKQPQRARIGKPLPNSLCPAKPSLGCIVRITLTYSWIVKRMIPSPRSLPPLLVKTVSIPLKEKGLGAGCLAQSLSHLMLYGVLFNPTGA